MSSIVSSHQPDQLRVVVTTARVSRDGGKIKGDSGNNRNYTSHDLIKTDLLPLLHSGTMI